MATTTDQTIQTAKERSRQGTEIQRLRRAIARPPPCQNAPSSGRQSWIAPFAASAPSAPVRGSAASPQFGQLQRRHALDRRSTLHLAHRHVHPDCRCRDDGEEQPEAALPDAREIVERAEGDRQDEATETAPTRPTTPPTAPTRPG